MYTSFTYSKLCMYMYYVKPSLGAKNYAVIPYSVKALSEKKSECNFGKRRP